MEVSTQKSVALFEFLVSTKNKVKLRSKAWLSNHVEEFELLHQMTRKTPEKN